MYKHARAPVKLNKLSESDASSRFRENLPKLFAEFGRPEMNISNKEVLRRQNAARRKLLAAGLLSHTVSRLPKLILNYPDPLSVYRKWCELNRWRDESKRNVSLRAEQRAAGRMQLTVHLAMPATRGHHGISSWHGDSFEIGPSERRAATIKSASLAYRPSLTEEEREKKRNAKVLRRKESRLRKLSPRPAELTMSLTPNRGNSAKKKTAKKKSRKRKKSGDMYSLGIRLPGSGFSRG